MTERAFKETSERYGSKFRKVARIWCCKCGVSHAVNLATPGGFLPSHAIRKKLGQIGWVVGANADCDFCPDHANSLKEKKAPMLKVVEQSKPSPSETAPREMTRDDRRIIISKLDAVYLDSKRGYDSGWSDQKVADDLGVPRKWVETIRSENFGDVGGNEEMSEFYEQAKVLLDDARKLIDEAVAAHNRLGQSNAIYFAELRDRLVKVEKMANAVRKYVAV